MGNETYFRIYLLVLTLAIYSVRLWYRHASRAHQPTQAPLPMATTLVMGIWFASLLMYSLGVDWFDYRLPASTPVRWLGFACMAATLPLFIWVRSYDRIADYFLSRIWSTAARHVQPERDELLFNPVYATFCLCAVGTILLSASGIILLTSTMAIAAMGMGMKRQLA